MTTPEESQVARLRWLLESAAKEAGINVGRETIARMTVSMQRVMCDQGLYLVWQSAVDDAVKRMETRQ